MRVRLLAFARLRELLGWSERDVETADGTDVRTLWEHLEAECAPLAALQQSTRVAINGSLLRDWTTRVCAGDEVAFLPPSSGG